MSKKRGPFCIVKSGNVPIPIYRIDNKGYAEFRVVWRDAQNKRCQKAFADEAEARQHAGGVGASINSGDIKTVTLSDADRHTYLDALAAITGLNTPLNRAAYDYADAVKRLGPVSLKEAVNFYLKHNAGMEVRTVTQVFNEFVTSKRTPSKNKKRASEKHLDDIESRLGKFADAFQCKISDVTPKQISEFLTSLGDDISGRTWFNYARLIRSLFNYAKAKKYVPSNVEPMEGIDIEYNDDGEIEIFTPEELKKLFSVARPEIIPFLAIAAFAGVRHAEIARLDWQQISHTHIEIKASSAKTFQRKGSRARRVIEIQPNLAKWLADYRKDSGPVAPFANMSKQLMWLAEDAKVEWKHNAPRHSFISYRLAKTNDENLTAVEAGNSPAMIYQSYRQIKDHTGRVITPALADAWFGIEPETNEKIVPMLKAG
jgi:integrase